MIVNKSNLIFSLVLFFLISDRTSFAQEVKTSVCELSKPGYAEKLNGKKVRLAAIYTTNKREYSGFMDRRCKNIALSAHRSKDADNSVRLFFDGKEMRSCAYDGEIQFHVDISGIFIKYDESLDSGMFESHYGAIEVKKVRSFKPLKICWT